jgi:hypothetical protein
MAKAQSFKSEPWTSLDKGTWGKVFDDDYISDKLVFKFTQKTSTSTVSLKETINLKETISNSGEVKLWFPFGRNTLYAKVKSDSYKLHLDNGSYERNGCKFNIYGSVSGGRNLGNEQYKLGVETTKDDWSSNLRIAVKPSEHNATVYSKKSYSKDSWSFGTVNAFQLFKNTWNYSALQLGWQDKCGNSYYLRANAGSKFGKIDPSNFIKDVTADFIYKYSPNTNFGLEVPLH